MTQETAVRDPDLAAGSAAAGPRFEPGHALATALLYRRCDPAELPFELCTELDEAPGLIGQERAVEAIRFAMRLRRKGYNVYGLGVAGTGRHALVEDLLRQRAAAEPTPPDWCYVNNFADPTQPHHLQFPAGRGAGFAAAMKRLVEELRTAGSLRARRIPFAPRGHRPTAEEPQRGGLRRRATARPGQKHRPAAHADGAGAGAGARRQGLAARSLRRTAGRRARAHSEGNRRNPERARGGDAAGAAMGARASRRAAGTRPRNVGLCSRAPDGRGPRRLSRPPRSGAIPRRRRGRRQGEHAGLSGARHTRAVRAARFGDPGATRRRLRRRALSPLRRQPLRRQWRSRGGAGRLRGQPDASDARRSGRASRPLRRPRHRLQPFDCRSVAPRQWRLPDPRCAEPRGRQFRLGIAEARLERRPDPHRDPRTAAQHGQYRLAGARPDRP
jgi:Lon-like LonC helical domain